MIYYNYDQNATIKALRSFDATYIAITKRMREEYILDLNLPQEPMTNEQMYEDYFIKIYDNGDVRVYETGLK